MMLAAEHRGEHIDVAQAFSPDLKRVRVERNEIGPLSRSDRSDLAVHAQLVRGAESDCMQRLPDIETFFRAENSACRRLAIGGTPGHVNAMAASVGKFLQVHPLSGLNPGEVLLTNENRPESSSTAWASSQ